MKLDNDQVRDRLASLNGWRLQGDAIEKTFEFEAFDSAIAFVNRVAGAAENADHHPDITIHYNVVILSLSTHHAGGLTVRDFDLASQIDALPK